jgi:hypothetical protein
VRYIPDIELLLNQKQINMTIKKLGSYRTTGGKNPGTLMFRYAVVGTPAELESYKKAQGDFHRVDESTGTPLYFTNKFAGNSANLIITAKGRVIADMSAFDAANSLAIQYGGNLGQELAKQAVAQLLNGSSAAPVAAVTAPESDLSKS